MSSESDELSIDIQEELLITTLSDEAQNENLNNDEEIELLDRELTEENWEDIQSLSLNDVTSPSPVIPPQAILIEDNEDEDAQVPDDNFLTPEPDSSWSNWDRNQNTQASTSSVRNICQEPLVWPMSLWGNNRSDEVEALERFLIARWLLTQSNWVFWNDVFDAVREFQEEFRAEVLTPWGINNPTGFVGRTTIQKIQELACN